jgi:hypothetical protein
MMIFYPDLYRRKMTVRLLMDQRRKCGANLLRASKLKEGSRLLPPLPPENIFQVHLHARENTRATYTCLRCTALVYDIIAVVGSQPDVFHVGLHAQVKVAIGQYTVHILAAHLHQRILVPAARISQIQRIAKLIVHTGSGHYVGHTYAQEKQGIMLFVICFVVEVQYKIILPRLIGQIFVAGICYRQLYALVQKRERWKHPAMWQLTAQHRAQPQRWSSCKNRITNDNGSAIFKPCPNTHLRKGDIKPHAATHKKHPALPPKAPCDHLNGSIQWETQVVKEYCTLFGIDLQPKKQSSAATITTDLL